MRVALQPAYLLHTRSYRESSLLLEALSREHGRIGLVARGARGSRSRWKNMLQPFRPLLLSWTQRGELGTLTEADQVASPPQLIGESLFCGLYANELLMRFLHRSDPHASLFDHYQYLLGKLATGENLQSLLRVFEKQLLEAAGFGLQLEYEHGSKVPISADAWYVYVPGTGPVRRPQTDGDEKRISGEALLALNSEQIQHRHLKELKQLMRSLIRHQLGHKPLTSQTLFS
jgi:DNA repair protein RecO (recombination protein O)